MSYTRVALACAAIGVAVVGTVAVQHAGSHNASAHSDQYVLFVAQHTV